MAKMALNVAARKQLYLLLAWFLLCLVIAATVATTLTAWTYRNNVYYGPWSTCTYDATGAWNNFQCEEYTTRPVCNAWYQTVRVLSVMVPSMLGLAMFLCVAAALQSIITTLIPLIITIVLALTVLLSMFTYLSWSIYITDQCANLNGGNVGPSYVLEVIVFGFTFIATLVAAYLFKCDILMPAGSPELDRQEIQYDVVDAAPMAMPTPTYAYTTY